MFTVQSLSRDSNGWVCPWWWFLSPLAVLPHFIVARGGEYAWVRWAVCFGTSDGHLVPTNVSVARLKWPPTHICGLCSSRRRRALPVLEITAFLLHSYQQPLAVSLVSAEIKRKCKIAYHLYVYTKLIYHNCMILIKATRWDIHYIKHIFVKFVYL